MRDNHPKRSTGNFHLRPPGYGGQVGTQTARTDATQSLAETFGDDTLNRLTSYANAKALTSFGRTVSLPAFARLAFARLAPDVAILYELCSRERRRIAR